MVTPVAPRTVNDVSYVMRTKYVSLASWQAQYLSLFVAGAVLRQVLVSLFVAGAVFGEGLNVRLGAKRCIFQ